MPVLIQDGEGRTAVFVVLLLSFVLLLIYSPGHTKMGKWKAAEDNEVSLFVPTNTAAVGAR